MSNKNKIPVIDLFAGPGGLAEGFSSVFDDSDRVFDIKLSIEKDRNAHETLELRSFCRQFPVDKLPEDYYEVLKESVLSKREDKKENLFKNHQKQYNKAKKEAWHAELGHDDFPTSLVDKRIIRALKNKKDWLLIGGPPCQAYSMAGRSRVGGIDKEDHRVYLYKEYLRIIADHQPAVFVMENVRGLLSAKVDGEKVFNWILRDLQDPSSVFKHTNSSKYKVHSLSSNPVDVDMFGNSNYNSDKDFLIHSEQYGIPQKRHRVILIGIREDIKIKPEILLKREDEIALKDVIGDLPKIRSVLGRSIISTEIIDGKIKRKYRREVDSDKNWEKIINNLQNEITSWNGFERGLPKKRIKVNKNGIGSEYVKFKTPNKENPLNEWYADEKLNGSCNHISRSHLILDLKRYLFSSLYTKKNGRFPRLHDFDKHSLTLLPDHKSAKSGKFTDRFRVQLPNEPATTVTSHISKDGHYFIHYDHEQCRSLTVREAARIQTFPDNYLFCGPRTAQYQQVGNAVPPYLANQIAEIVYKLFNKIPDEN